MSSNLQKVYRPILVYLLVHSDQFKAVGSTELDIKFLIERISSKQPSSINVYEQGFIVAVIINPNPGD